MADRSGADLARRIREIIVEEISSGADTQTCVRALIDCAPALVDRRAAHAIVEERFDDYHRDHRELMSAM